MARQLVCGRSVRCLVPRHDNREPGLAVQRPVLMPRWRRFPAAWLPGILMIVACGTVDATPKSAQSTDEMTATPLITIAPTVAKDDVPTSPPLPTAPTPSPDDPFTLAMKGSPAPPLTPEELVTQTDLVVSGQIVEVLPAQWTTPDGRRPPNPHHPGLVPTEIYIVTPYILELDHQLVVDHNTIPSVDNRVVLVAFGGQIGDDVIVLEFPRVQFSVGERVIVALTRIDPYGRAELAIPTPAGTGWTVRSQYTLGEGGNATDYAGSQSADELIAAIIAAAEQSPAVLP